MDDLGSGRNEREPSETTGSRAGVLEEDVGVAILARAVRLISTLRPRVKVR